MTGRNGGIDAFCSRIDVSRETITRLETYEALLKKWNPAINLVGPSTLAAVWTRHFLDSAQIWALRPEGVDKWLDLGSGGGFPGMVIAIIAAGRAPGLRVTLVESDQRKATFLRVCAREMGLEPEIRAERIEKLPPQGAKVVSARALAPLDSLFQLAARHLDSKGVLLLPKGQNAESELTQARKCWTFRVEKHQSLTEKGGVILKIGGLGRADP